MTSMDSLHPLQEPLLRTYDLDQICISFRQNSSPKKNDLAYLAIAEK